MDRNSITGILLIVAILIGYSVITKPSREEMAEQQRVADSISYVRQQDAMAAASATELNNETDKPV